MQEKKAEITFIFSSKETTEQSRSVERVHRDNNEVALVHPTISCNNLNYPDQEDLETKITKRKSF